MNYMEDMDEARKRTKKLEMELEQTRENYQNMQNNTRREMEQLRMTCTQLELKEKEVAFYRT